MSSTGDDRTGQRAQVRDFLVSRRERVTPEEAGLPAYGGGNRRVKGLRREEVALLAGVSVDYYVRMERGNLGGASDAVLEGVANALQLDEAEREHLFALARAASKRPANTTRFLYLDPGARKFFIDYDRMAQDAAAMRRLEAGRNPYDKDLITLVGELSTQRELFRQHWASQNVKFHRSGRKRLRHPVVGELDLNFEAMAPASEPELRLNIYTADPTRPPKMASSCSQVGQPPPSPPTRSHRCRHLADGFSDVRVVGMAPVAGDGFNHDFWLGMVTAGPVLLVAFSALLPAADDAFFIRKSGQPKWPARLRKVGGGLVLAGAITATADLTITAAGSLQARRDGMSPSTAVWVLLIAIILLTIIGLAVAWRTTPAARLSHEDAGRDGAESSAPDPDRPTGRDTTAPIEQPTRITPPAHRSATLLLAAVALGGLIYRAGFTHRDQPRSR